MIKLREFAEQLVGRDADVIEAALIVRMREVAAREWDDMDERNLATRSGRFWLPCPLCGTWIGGHQNHRASITVEGNEYGGSGMGCCVDCHADADRINTRWKNGINEVINELKQPCTEQQPAFK